MSWCPLARSRDSDGVMVVAAECSSVPQPIEDGLTVEPLRFRCGVGELVDVGAVLLEDLTQCPARDVALSVGGVEEGLFVGHGSVGGRVW